MAKNAAASPVVTVERHKYSLTDKLKLHTTAELNQYTIKRGLIPAP